MSDVGKLLEDKLYAHQAILVKVTDAAEGNDGGTIELHGHQIGSLDKVKSITRRIRSYFFDILKENKFLRNAKENS
jgi:hypothetical protein